MSQEAAAQPDEKIRAAHPRLGGMLLAPSSDPESTTAWATGAAGEVAAPLLLRAPRCFGAGTVLTVLDEPRRPRDSP